MKKLVIKSKGLSDKAIGWLFIAPTIILLLLINVYPLIYAIRMSFTNFYANKLTQVVKNVGLKNYWAPEAAKGTIRTSMPGDVEVRPSLAKSD